MEERVHKILFSEVAEEAQGHCKEELVGKVYIPLCAKQSVEMWKNSSWSKEAPVRMFVSHFNFDAVRTMAVHGY